MDKYKIISQNYRKYNLIHNSSIIAQLSYEKWYNHNNPKISIENKTNCSIEKMNIWKSNFKAKIKDKVILEFIFGWNSIIKINYIENEILKKESFWNSNYIILDGLENQICKIETKYTWRNWKTNYIITNYNFPYTENKELIYLTIIHCIILLNISASAV